MLERICLPAQCDILLNFLFAFAGKEISNAFGNAVGLNILKNHSIKTDIQFPCDGRYGFKSRTAAAAFQFYDCAYTHVQLVC